MAFWLFLSRVSCALRIPAAVTRDHGPRGGFSAFTEHSRVPLLPRVPLTFLVWPPDGS